ncbi:MAG: hypothetical protein FJ109_16590, partial [Deltaproteobacteria bacterium]|nr:hypothetical protein [Deltaproteobacteria bacterium]
MTRRVFRLGIVPVLRALVLYAMTACSGGQVNTLDQSDAAADLPGTVDAAADLPEPVDRTEQTGLPEVGPDVPWTEWVEPGCEPGSGCFMDPCEANDDCWSGFCVSHMGDQVCTTNCVEECTDGWVCGPVQGPAPDSVFVCKSPYPQLCTPCRESGDCGTPSGSFCVSYGQFGEEAGSFCGADCEKTPCPAGFSCVMAPTMEGQIRAQCVATDGECFCSKTAAAKELSTDCTQSNEAGTCTGMRKCTPAGLTECDAAVPAEETCNGLDDDCNGETDEATCDDGNPCTKDSCDPNTGCIQESLDGGSCDDGDVCTLADHCQEAACVGTTIDCNDGNPCTFDNCNPVGGCNYTFSAAPCDDGDPCTVADVCSQGSCKGFAVACDCTSDLDCLKLEDGDACNGTLFCDQGEVPYKCKVEPATVVVCPELKGEAAACAKSVCVAETGQCETVPANEGKSCEDGSVCTAWDSCKGGACMPGLAVGCDDANVCTTDACDTKLGCTYVPADGGPCDDLNECTTEDACLGGMCKGTGSTECDDSNPCTKDICLPGGGCQHEPAAVACSDGNACTLNDKCVDGKCIPGAMLDCNDGNVCTTDACTGAGVCTHEPNAKPCNDFNECTAGDSCKGGACMPGLPVACDDGNVCTTDSCNPATGCAYVVNTLACDDGNACTLKDTCSKGGCTGGPAPSCDDGNPCTDDACEPAAGCKHTPNAKPCDDLNACTTVDVCAQGKCVGSAPPDCGDGNVCTDDSCDPVKGCQHKPNTAPCADGDVCTLGDVCGGGACVPGKPMACDDGNECTLDGCDPVLACTHSPLDGACDDGNQCTSGDACVAGKCQGLKGVSCDDGNLCTDDSCLPQSGCQHENNKAPCDDKDVCTTLDTCFQGACIGSGDFSCEDGNVCTDDACDPVAGCQHDPQEGGCNDGNVCTLTDVCVAGVCIGSGNLDCSDGKACTKDTCDASKGCQHADLAPCCSNGAVDGTEECDDGNLVAGDGCDASCKVETQTSCRTLHEKMPNLPSGVYTIDLDGAGPAGPLQVRCDMTLDGGGWTLVAVARFGQHGQPGWNDNNDLNPAQF